ncbi:hypothetical protein [Priestia megaterium]|uniref:hypothetical protein n=1 Tax=Priestia megaterium TaxID=1404 RepID=UPI000BFC60E0|nr:hypothetical protein [Priestia megaterium]PGO60657.1 hypothetical protein CN981_08900 [Priestia megaterium]
MEIKCGRETFQLTSEDVIMYNGSIYQLVTKRAGVGWGRHIPVIAKTKAIELIKKGLIKRVELEDPPFNTSSPSLYYYKISE